MDVSLIDTVGLSVCVKGIKQKVLPATDRPFSYFYWNCEKYVIVIINFYKNFLHISPFCKQVMKFFAHVSTVPMRGLANSERRAACLRGLAHSAATVLQAVGWRPCD